MSVYFFFFNDTATTEIYTLSLHDALPILGCQKASSPHAGSATTLRQPTGPSRGSTRSVAPSSWARRVAASSSERSEEHTSELQSQSNLVCRLLLDKKKNIVGHAMRVPT